MDTLVSMGSLSALLWSAVVLVGEVGGGLVYFETGAVIISLILLGKWFELLTKRHSGDAIRALADLGAKTAQLEDGSKISLDDLAVGMRFVVKPGEKVAADGVVADGRSAVDASMLTGDNARTAASVASSVGIGTRPGDDVISAVYPDDKAAVITRLQEAGYWVAVVGNGINDAPALAQADLGIAVGTGTDVAIEAWDLTVVSGDLRAVADAIALSRRTLAVIKGNLFWVFAYNTAAMPLAALGVLNPMIAAGAMGLSSLFVVSSSLRLRRFAGYRSPVS